ncbi:hypothetical protein PRIPAC_75298 [Pristionchus pacificus]|uniref:Uncharacterized protein n=1 Tax=Pristionchus pacificus TaxID=54126 RepID=A0A454XWL0_PRIPA|nr:hypothetical protein PRIPAC_75298 [Pristionchus pacificus]|eukprot:PDM61002.1 hypothetical protein PRIPAC_54808 [Pristionchus pacificus]
MTKVIAHILLIVLTSTIAEPQCEWLGCGEPNCVDGFIEVARSATPLEGILTVFGEVCSTAVKTLCCLIGFTGQP